MNTVLTRIQVQASRVDRSRSLMIGISAGVAALWAVYRLFWLLYAASALSGVGVSAISLVFPFVLWVAVAISAAATSAVFLIRYAKQS